MYELALFAGAGGGILGGKLLGWQTICYVEREPYPVEIIKARIQDGWLDDAPIWDDVTTFDGRPWAGLVDVITAGFPCQPWSAAGKRAGEADERNLWPDTIRVICEVRPEWVLLENSPRLLTQQYFGRILADLAEGGFGVRWDCIPAAAVGAPHLRDRLWIMAHADSDRHGRSKTRDSALDKERDDPSPQSSRRHKFYAPVSGSEDVPNASSVNVEEPRNLQPQSGFAICDWWKVEPGLGRVVDGMAHRVDRLKAVGNGQVPAVARAAWEHLARG